MQTSLTPESQQVGVSGLRKLWIGLATIAVLGLLWWPLPGIGGLWTGVFGTGAGVAGMITLAAPGRASLTADRRTGQLIPSCKAPLGGGIETHPLFALQGAKVTPRKSCGSSPSCRGKVVLATGQRWALTRTFGAAGPANAATQAINGWLASDRSAAQRA